MLGVAAGWGQAGSVSPPVRVDALPHGHGESVVALRQVDERARERMICTFSIHDTVHDWAAAYHFDIYLRGPGETPFERAH